MNSEFDSIIVNGISLRPAPFVSTSYEYNMSGKYIIGGMLIINLSGTIVDENLINQISSLIDLKINTDCVSITIGCSGGSNFLNGSGRIRSISITPSDQPYVASYSMQIAVETINNQPAVAADPDFKDKTCLNDVPGYVNFLQSYNESLGVVGEGSVIGSVDNVLQISKSYIKASGKINILSYMRNVCGISEYEGLKNSIEILKVRAQSLMNMSVCVENSPLSQFAGWNRWLDTKSLIIDYNGNVEWVYDMYLSQGSCQPIAWIDITTEDKTDQRKQLNTKTINGTIRGLSSATINDYLGDKVNVNERIMNAKNAYNALEAIIKNGSWPSDGVLLTASECMDPYAQCPPPPMCLQRTSSNIKTSPVIGEISFSAEFAPIGACLPSNVEINVEEQLSTVRHKEYIIPGAGDAVVIDLNAPSPHRVTITGRGSISNCDRSQLPQLMGCVDAAFNDKVNEFLTSGSWITVKNTKTIGTYSYTKIKEFVECNS